MKISKRFNSQFDKFTNKNSKINNNESNEICK